MILLLEGASGLLATINGIIEHHDIELLHNPTFVAKKTRDALRYRRRFIQSIVERGTTFDKRIDNMISLFFSHVSLQDSGILMKDSSSLRSIALLTLVFLPVTTVATIFGAEFVYLTEDGNGSHLNLHPTGWKVLTGSAIGTCLLILAWFLHLGWLEKRFARGRMASPSINSGIIQD
jgi:Mg2+ and Co2+ transporter CorA